MKKLSDVSLETADLETLSVMRYKCCVYGNHTAVVEGHKGLKKFGDSEIQLRVGKGSVSVTGQVSLALLTDSSAVIKGHITGVRYDDF